MPVPVLPVTAPPNNWLSSGTAGATVTGNPLKNNQLAATNTGVTLVGAGRGDTFLAYSSGTKIVEAAGGGIDTVIANGGSFTLGANVENLTLKGTVNGFATGNAGANRIFGNEGANRITTGGGNDVLTGGNGADTFVFTKQAGTTSWITDFDVTSAARDTLDLTGYGFRNLAALTAARRPGGAPLRIDLGGAQSVILANRQMASVTQSAAIVDTRLTDGLTLTFHDEFDSLSLRTGTAATKGNVWKTTFFGGERTLVGNRELELYVDPDYKGSSGHALGINPFSISDGVLSVAARPVTQTDKPYLHGFNYTSGLLTTQGSFAQTYGYFEIRADNPAGKGLFPAFWLLATDGKWPPEIDVYEQIGSARSYVSNGVLGSLGNAHVKGTYVGLDATAGFHTYSMDWTAQTITFYFDGKQTYQVATPQQLHKPMYVLIDLAVGGNWPGSPDATTDWSKADLLIDYVRIYSHDPNATPTPTPAAVVLSNAVDPLDPASTFAAPATGPGTSTTYTSAQLGIAGVASTTVTVAYDAANDVTITNTGAWNAIKNAVVTTAAIDGVTNVTFVYVEDTLGLGDNTVVVTDSKRGSIVTAGGDDTIVVTAVSNGSTGNLMSITTGGGDDYVAFTGGRNTRDAIVLGDGNDSVVVTGQASGAVNGGAGDDILGDHSTGNVVLTGGSGSDFFQFLAGAHATITDFVAGDDHIHLIGVAPAAVHVTAAAGSTQIDLGAGASVQLLGVSLTAAQIDLLLG